MLLFDLMFATLYFVTYSPQIFPLSMPQFCFIPSVLARVFFLRASLFQFVFKLLYPSFVQLVYILLSVYLF